MNNINGVNGYSRLQTVGQTVNRPVSRAAGQETSKNTIRGGDQVEISENAVYLSKIAAMPDIRQEKVEEIRQALASGSYDVEEKLPTAIENLLDEHLG